MSAYINNCLYSVYNSTTDRHLFKSDNYKDAARVFNKCSRRKHCELWLVDQITGEIVKVKYSKERMELENV